MESLNIIAEKYGFPVIVSTYSLTRKMIEKKQIEKHLRIQFSKPLGFHDYNALQMNSYAVCRILVQSAKNLLY
jgi:UDP-N-acetylglucosamine 2-epimerase (non-hydrolysing)